MQVHCNEKSDVPPAKLAKKVSDGLSSMILSSSAKTEDGVLWNIKITSWNINGVRAWLNVGLLMLFYTYLL